MGTEEARRHRNLRIESGDELAILKIKGVTKEAAKVHTDQNNKGPQQRKWENNAPKQDAWNEITKLLSDATSAGKGGGWSDANSKGKGGGWSDANSAGKGGAVKGGGKQKFQDLLANMAGKGGW